MTKLEKILLIIPILTGLLITGFIIKYQIDYSKEFSSYEWKQLHKNFVEDGQGVGTFEPLSEREKMVKSLIKSEQLIGKTMEEVLDILGDEGDSVDTNNLHYWIGYPWFGINQKYLDVIFENDIVSSITTHEG